MYQEAHRSLYDSFRHERFGDILFIIRYRFVVVILFLFERRKPKGGRWVLLSCTDQYPLSDPQRVSTFTAEHGRYAASGKCSLVPRPTPQQRMDYITAAWK